MIPLHYHFLPDSVTIHHDSQVVGTINFQENPYHNQHVYLTFHLSQYDPCLAASLFQTIHHQIKRPLQVMLDSTNQALITFLEAGGFRCRRKCYEVEVTAQDYIGKPELPRFQMAKQGEDIYDQCCQLLIQYYKETHQSVSPFTGRKEDFFKGLPSTVYYHHEQSIIQSLAFIEENEIAYLWGKSHDALYSFINQLVPYLFQQHTIITFEADDVDTCAMMLKSLFIEHTEEHWDTYILS